MFMKKVVNVKNIIIVALCVTLIFLAVGFIIMAVELKREKDEAYNYEVLFSEVMKSSSVKGSDKEPISSAEISNEGQLLKMKFSLNAPRDEVTYIAVIKNEGTVPVEVLGLFTSPDYSDNNLKNIISPVTITVSDVAGKTIDLDENLEVKIVVYYNPSTAGAVAKTFNYNLGIMAKAKVK